MAHSCQYEGCKVPAEDGSGFCIFHSPSPKDMEKFKSALSDQLNEVGLAEVRNERYCFDGYVFPTTITASDSPMDAILLPQTMEGDASFEKAKIKGDVVFKKAKIKGNAVFSRAKIEGDAWFKKAKIEGDVVFAHAQIKGNASFEDAQIEGDASFIHAQIERDATFQNVQIEGTAGFERSKIAGYAWFNAAKIEGDTSFIHAQIEGDATFENAQIEGYASFNGYECGSLALGFNNPHIRGCGNARCGIFISNPEAAVSFWRFAQRTFERMGEREKADAAFYFERINRWKVLRQNKADADETWITRLSKNWILRPGFWALFLFDLLFVRWTTAYGASLARLFFTWFLVIGGFGITFSMAPRLIERAGVQVWSLRNWIVGIHYSVTTFATLGLGRIGPGSSRLGMVLTSVEATLGAVLIALAVLVIGRRFMRQS